MKTADLLNPMLRLERDESAPAGPLAVCPACGCDGLHPRHGDAGVLVCALCGGEFSTGNREED